MNCLSCLSSLNDFSNCSLRYLQKNQTVTSVKIPFWSLNGFLLIHFQTQFIRVWYQGKEIISVRLSETFITLTLTASTFFYLDSSLVHLLVQYFKYFSQCGPEFIPYGIRSIRCSAFLSSLSDPCCSWIQNPFLTHQLSNQSISKTTIFSNPYINERYLRSECRKHFGEGYALSVSVKSLSNMVGLVNKMSRSDLNEVEAMKFTHDLYNKLLSEENAFFTHY